MNVPPDFNFEAFRMGKGGMGYPPPTPCLCSFEGKYQDYSVVCKVYLKTCLLVKLAYCFTSLLVTRLVCSIRYYTT